MSIRVMLADDHTIMRQGLSRAIQQEENMEVVGQAQDGLSTVALAHELAPDIVIMDISMPDLNGIEATRQIHRDSPDVKIIALSMHSTKRFVAEMFKVGASGYLLKDCDYEELTSAIRIVANGQTYLSPSISDVVIDNMVRNEEENPSNAFTVLTSGYARSCL